MSQEPDRVVDRHEGEKGSQGQDVEGRRHQGHRAGRRRPPETSIPLTTLTGFIIPLPTRAAPRIAITITMTMTMTIAIATVPSLTAALYPTTATNRATAIVPPTGEVC